MIKTSKSNFDTESRIRNSAGNYIKGLNSATAITIDDDYWFDRSVDVLNKCFGKNYAGWQRAVCWIDENRTELVWFPKLAIIENGIETAQSATKAWINVLSEDGSEIRMYNRENLAQGHGNHTGIIHHTFARYPGKGYKYVGSFVRDLSRSTSNDVIFIRVTTSVNIISS